MIQSISILGGGSAGLIAALTLRSAHPTLRITLIRSSKLGIIRVGEGTTAGVPVFFHGNLGLERGAFFRAVDPTYKLGVRLEWGARSHYDYAFTPSMTVPAPGLPRSVGFYCQNAMTSASPAMALMENGRFFLRGASGVAGADQAYGYHLANEKLVAYLEAVVRDRSIEIVDDELRQAVLGPSGIERLSLASGRTLAADLFVDASGFGAELIGKALSEPFLSFRSSLFCSRAVVGGWERTTEPVLPYTRSETMDAGWCWQIEHRHQINRGYVYAPDFITDEQAEAEFRRKNPKITQTRVVRFISGRHQRLWVGNVVAIGNAAGFVEPLEATAMGIICLQSEVLAKHLSEVNMQPTDSGRAHYNQLFANAWDATRWFLAVHYKFNGRLETPFWRAARAETDIGDAAAIVGYFQHQGPSILAGDALLPRGNAFGLDGYWVHLVGLQVPYAVAATIPPSEAAIWERQRAHYAALGTKGVRFEELPR